MQKLNSWLFILLFLPALLTAQNKKPEARRFDVQIVIDGIVYDAKSSFSTIIDRSTFLPTLDNLWPPGVQKQPLLNAIGPDFYALSGKARQRSVSKITIHPEYIIAYADVYFSFETIIFENLLEYNQYFEKTPFVLREITGLRLNDLISDPDSLKKLEKRIQSLEENYIRKNSRELRYAHSRFFQLNRDQITVEVGFGYDRAVNPIHNWEYVTHYKTFVLQSLPHSVVPRSCDLDLAKDEYL